MYLESKSIIISCRLIPNPRMNVSDFGLGQAWFQDLFDLVDGGRDAVQKKALRNKCRKQSWVGPGPPHRMIMYGPPSSLFCA